MHGLGAAPVAELFKLYLAGNQLLIFGAPIVNALALGALQFDESVLGHEFGIKTPGQPPAIYAKDYTL